MLEVFTFPEPSVYSPFVWAYGVPWIPEYSVSRPETLSPTNDEFAQLEPQKTGTTVVACITGPLCHDSWRTRDGRALLAWRDGMKPCAGLASSAAGWLPTLALLPAATMPATQSAVTTEAATDLPLTLYPLGLTADDSRSGRGIITNRLYVVKAPTGGGVFPNPFPLAGHESGSAARRLRPVGTHARR